jgi:hypothetical protein
MTEKNRKIFFTLVFALVFYVAGATFVESFVNYPIWHLIGPDTFQAYHNALSSRIIPFMVLPWFVEIILTFALMRFRPRSIPRPAIEFAQGFNLIALISSIFIQIPIQIQLGESGLSLQAIDKLIQTDPIRWGSLILKVALYVWMMLRVVNAGEAVSEQAATIHASTADSHIQ